MRLRTLLIKEWEEARRIKMVLFGVAFLPLFMLGMAVFMVWQARELPAEGQAVMLNTTLLYFMILPIMIPLSIAVYSIVGEKEQGTLEPLLATPITEAELFIGKGLAAMIPALAITWLTFGIFLAVTWATLGAVPSGVLSAAWLASILLLSPLLAAFAVLVTMLVSSKTSDPRAAYQFSSLALIPALVPLIVYSTQLTAVSLFLVAVQASVVLVLNGAILYLAVRLFRREIILTRWR